MERYFGHPQGDTFPFVFLCCTQSLSKKLSKYIHSEPVRGTLCSISGIGSRYGALYVPDLTGQGAHRDVSRSASVLLCRNNGALNNQTLISNEASPQ